MREEKRRRATKGINRAFAKQDTKERLNLKVVTVFVPLAQAKLQKGSVGEVLVP